MAKAGVWIVISYSEMILFFGLLLLFKPKILNHGVPILFDKKVVEVKYAFYSAQLLLYSLGDKAAYVNTMMNLFCQIVSNAYKESKDQVHIVRGL